MKLLRGVLLVGFSTVACGCGGGAGSDAATRDLLGPAPGGDGGDLGTVDAALDLAVPDLASPDLVVVEAGPVCDNTPKRCGAAGACVDCTGNTVGGACVRGVCGCVSSADCQVGAACDPKTAKCGSACAGGLACNGGCCDGQKCQPGTVNGACGSDGKACLACGLGTPSCAAGACTASCTVGKPGDPGACGTGFCCNAQSQCVALGNSSCGAPGAACSDCAASPSGAACLMNGSCGCHDATDCAAGQACKAGVCGTACDAQSPCKTGCCQNGSCVPGNTGAACATGNAACTSCVGNPVGAACVGANGKSACGCTGPNDCPANQACDPVLHACGTKCDLNAPCNGGCCSAAMNGTCMPGTVDGACGATGGVCVSCPMSMGGKFCKATMGGGQCGCNVLADCPVTAVACNNGVCDTTCSLQKPCQSGCCSAGKCAPGTASAACGPSGTCTDCTVAVAGAACRPNQACGCEKTGDCQPGMACNVTTHLCEAKCSAMQPCNGGCCSAMMNGTCVAGNVGSACGNNGICVDCTANKLGHACVGGAACGCAKAGDCSAFQSCDANASRCTSACGQNQLCNGGCCLSGSCVAGTANSGCGSDGAACAACAGGTPTCDQSVCIARCGGPNDGNCGGGNCCSMGMCVAGNAQTTCGYTGGCIDCSKQSTGTKCIAPMNSQSWGCGCTAKTDCLPANPGAGIPGYACDLTNQSCTSVCGIPNVLSGCNGGCCSGANGQCRAGSVDSACGITGGICSNCSLSCNPGPKCIAGSCGCNTVNQCNAATPCFMGGVNRFGCNIATTACCVPGIYNFPDNGNPQGCCTGASMNGACTCLLNGAPTGNPAEAWQCCSLSLDMNGNCACLGTGANVNFGLGAEPRGCCSNRASGNACVCSPKGGTCQSTAGCCAPQTCQNGVCT